MKSCGECYSADYGFKRVEKVFNAKSIYICECITEDDEYAVNEYSTNFCRKTPPAT
jgi:hypothetical protein